MRAIEMKVLDQGGEPVSDLSINGKLYHHASANQVEPIKLDSVGEGRYLALAPAERAGLWQIELTLDGAPEPMTQSITFFVEE